MLHFTFFFLFAMPVNGFQAIAFRQAPFSSVQVFHRVSSPSFLSMRKSYLSYDIRFLCKVSENAEDADYPKSSNFFLQYLSDIVDYLDQKGGYVITEQQLKSGLGEQDLQQIKQAFDRPKRKPASSSINLFIISLTAIPLIAWFKYALDNPCSIFHLC